MIDLNLGGACPRRSLVHVLPRTMVVPNVCAYEPLTGINFAVMACDGALRDSIPILANSVQDTGRPALIATFAEAKLSVCSGLTLFRPVPTGVEIGMVEPCLLRNGGAITLLAADRSKLFKLNAQGKLVERRVPTAAHKGDGVDRGWADLKRCMAELTRQSGRFPLASWEVHIEPC
jgi:hypothetical protein